jgi:hypothetical protein
MRRRTWIAVTVGVVATVVLVFLALGRRQQDESWSRVVSMNVAKADQLKSLLDQRFVTGSLESEVVPALEREFPGYVRWPATDWTEYGVPVATEPSEVWYCGSWTRGVKLRFESGRLVRTTADRWSFDCL